MIALATTVGLIVAIVASFTVIGVAVLAWCDDRARPLGTSTLVGAAATLLWLGLVGVVVPPGSGYGATALLVAATAVVASAWRWRRPRLAIDRREVTALAGTVAVGLACTAPFLVIVAGARSSAVVHLSGSHDAFFFTAVPEWLMGHRTIGGGSNVLGSVWDYWQSGSLRLGSESLTAVVARLTRSDPLNLWLPLTLAFHVLFGVAVQAVVARLRGPGIASVVVAAVAGVSALLLAATTDQHTPTLLALALALTFFAELADPSRDGADLPTAVVVAVLLGGIVACYGEVLVLFVVPVVALLGVRVLRGEVPSARWCLAVVGWSVALAAAPWARALGAAGGVRSPVGYPSAFDSQAGWATVARRLALGGGAGADATWARTSTFGRLLTVGFVAAVVVGLVAVVRLGVARAWWAGLVVSIVAGRWWLGLLHDGGYRQQRLVEWGLPLLVVGAGLGWCALVDRAGAVARPRAAPASAALGLTIALLVAAPGVVAGQSVDDDPHRRVDAAFGAPDAWLADRDPTGADTVVWARSYLANLWTPYVLRQRADTSYLSIYRDYYLIDHIGSLAGRRWLLLDRDALGSTEVDPAAVVAANERYSLVDLDAGPVRLTVPPDHRGRWSPQGLTVSITFDDGRVACSARGKVLPCR